MYAYRKSFRHKGTLRSLVHLEALTSRPPVLEHSTDGIQLAKAINNENPTIFQTWMLGSESYFYFSGLNLTQPCKSRNLDECYSN